MKEIKRRHTLFVALLLCILQVARVGVHAQETTRDSLVMQQVLQQERLLPDSLGISGLDIDSIVSAVQVFKDSIPDNLPAVADSLAKVNKENMERLQETVVPKELTLLKTDSIRPVAEKKIWMPDPKTATWLAVVFPGAGQIYNRKYWKLPIFYGGFAGCAYALSWNDKMFKDYGNAYADLMSGDPTRTSYKDIYPSTWTTDRMKSHSKRQRDYFRRYRDISIFAFIGVYLLSIIDAYVDAELSDFDISPDLSLRIEPKVINSSHRWSGNAIGLQCSIRF